MKTKLAVLILLVLFGSLSIAQDDFESTTYKKVGDQVPQFKVVSLTGNFLSSDDFKGKVVLINFWATWCPPCRTEFPILQKDIYDKIKDNNFIVIAISRKEAKDTVKQFIEKTKYTFPIYLDPDAAVYNLFANKFIPRNFVIGKDGKIKWATMGFKKEEFQEMIKLIEEDLKK